MGPVKSASSNYACAPSLVTGRCDVRAEAEKIRRYLARKSRGEHAVLLPSTTVADIIVTLDLVIETLA